jgi:hypothetical protein
MTAISHPQPSFEETYPKAPFAELIRLALSLTDAMVKLRARLTGSAPAGTGRRQHA